MPVVARGAEAVLTRENGILIKERVKKSYRIGQLDKKLRLERTRMEARLLSEARRAGVSTPKIVGVDEKNATIKMEFVEGKKLKEILDGLEEEKQNEIMKSAGVSVGKLHAAGIIHGDLTTSNIILAERKDNITLTYNSGAKEVAKVFFIDFGLGSFSNRAEDFGTDLAVLHEALRSTHFPVLRQAWGAFLEGYMKSFGGAEQSLKALAAIEKRGRYVRRKKQEKL